MGAPSNGSKTAHSKVANGTNAGTSGNTNQTTTSKRSSSGADGDYQLVQHEVLYSQSSQYEVSSLFTRRCVLFFSFSSSCFDHVFRASSLKNIKYMFIYMHIHAAAADCLPVLKPTLSCVEGNEMDY